MFWKYDDEEEKVVLKEEPKKLPLTPSEFIEMAHKAGHASFVHGLDEEDQDRIFEELARKQGTTLEELVKKAEEESDDGFMSSDETGAEQRFESRVSIFKKEDKPVYKHHFWWFVHNCIAHPMIGIYPCKKTFDFHDWTSKKINGK